MQAKYSLNRDECAAPLAGMICSFAGARSMCGDGKMMNGFKANQRRNIYSSGKITVLNPSAAKNLIKYASAFLCA
jgi:hypothetical protein